MWQALNLAKVAYEEDEVPVGALVVLDGEVIGKGYNLTERLRDVTAHAEMQAITAASEYLGGKYLEYCSLYVTLEPCTMCAGALYWSRISELYYGASDFKHGFTNYCVSLHPKTKVYKGLMEKECLALVQSFFEERRK
ncbi:tRNA-specific adenosine deaminase [Elysia marginata]|uniref:tRNA-specific adenosine deaminase 2 n=1 Tax=Elysia marginata TaxID=1093978 RepID=A0AAV4H090_9GAST|nr:tRNA-specific adenosine deaminase [Elysia marginata]